MAKVIVKTDDGQLLGEYLVTASPSAEGDTWNLQRSFARRTLAQSIRKLVEHVEREESAARTPCRW